ncbi:MAG: phosphodiester glycosidase family protein [Fimbriimonas sp.]
MLALRAFGLLGVILFAQTTPAPRAQVWERHPAAGITYRMEIEAEPGRVIHALRFDRKAPQYWATSSLANDEVYDLKPTNGRGTMSQMVRDAGAIGGVNGDFFQWGDDPGGDPVGIMVRNGELLSHPGGTGSRAPSIGWGRGEVRIADRCTWTASFEAGKERLSVSGLNEYARPGALTLATPASGYAISKAAAVFLILRTPAAILKPRGEVVGTVVGIEENREKVPVPPGTMILMGRGVAAESLRRLPLGAPVKIRTQTEGYDFGRIDNVVGGGPVLVRRGVLAPGAAEDVRHPRTAMGIDKDGNVWYAIVDGRQPMSVGATLKETGEVMRRLGCVEAINLDGGGSSSMSLFGTTLNRPSGGVERMVANGILWHGPIPRAAGDDLTIEGPSEVSLTGTSQLKVPKAPKDGVVWTCQGAAWIDQDGLVRPIKEGPATVQALVGGKVLERKIDVK